MCFARRYVVALCLLAFIFNGKSVGQVPLDDPIPTPIPRGTIAVNLQDFLQAPKTVDQFNDPFNTTSHARIQYILPVGDNSGRLAFNDIRGLLYFTDKSGAAPTTYLDLRAQDVGFFPVKANETGLMGFAFHPDFANVGTAGFGKFYTSYTASPTPTPNYVPGTFSQLVIREWTADDPSSQTFSGTSREIIRVGQPATNHGIGTLGFNPTAQPGSADYGMLYAGFGDGGGFNDFNNYGQGLSEPLGAIIRIDPLGGSGGAAYGIPGDNPFAGSMSAANEIWAYGLRHPQQFSWDSNGQMYLIDIGQERVEEVNLGVAGGNYGWQLREGTFATAFAVTGDKNAVGVYELPANDDHSFIYPVAQYDRTDGRAISSGFVYEGTAIPELMGKYVFSELVRGRLFYADVDDLELGMQASIYELILFHDGAEINLLDEFGQPNPFVPGTLRADLRLGVDDEGELYILTKTDGWIRKLTAVPETGAWSLSALSMALLAGIVVVRKRQRVSARV